MGTIEDERRKVAGRLTSLCPCVRFGFGTGQNRTGWMLDDGSGIELDLVCVLSPIEKRAHHRSLGASCALSFHK